MVFRRKLLGLHFGLLFELTVWPHWQDDQLKKGFTRSSSVTSTQAAVVQRGNASSLLAFAMSLTKLSDNNMKPVNVFARIRPPPSGNSGHGCLVFDENQITVNGHDKTFSFDRVFGPVLLCIFWLSGCLNLANRVSAAPRAGTGFQFRAQIELRLPEVVLNTSRLIGNFCI